MRVARYEIDGLHPADQTSGTENATLYLWLPMIPGVTQDDIVELDSSGMLLTITEAGTYLVTAQLNCQVTLPNYADGPQHAEITGALAYDQGGIGT